ncbi:hypothetical protein [Bacillus sp. Marseille-Q3570]|uniref:hypothetical protein n=1 Tax=Bacillus sp. Marseille-Q3570 TaxID=2963522 RepID=UPI0021B8407B|nr:hypothetical protein [Bacillus sp. Marseille-Q3570]
MKDSRFHCCATCIHFEVQKGDDGVRHFCSRLGYETKPDYRFNCWKPKENVQKLIEKEKKKQ